MNVTDGVAVLVLLDFAPVHVEPSRVDPLTVEILNQSLDAGPELLGNQRFGHLELIVVLQPFEQGVVLLLLCVLALVRFEIGANCLA